MSVTLFGVIWITLLFYLFYLMQIEKIITTLFFSMVLQCNNVIVIGETGIGPQLITTFFFIATYFFLQRNSVERKTNHSKFFLIVLFVFCFYALSNALILNIEGGKFMEIASLYIYLFASVCLYDLRACISDNFIWIVIKKLYIFLVIAGGLQFLSTTGVIPKWLLSEFLFNDKSEYVYYHVNYFYPRVTSTFMEPSYFSSIFCGLLISMIYNRRKLRYPNLLIIVGVVELLLTVSTTGYLTFLCGLIFLMLLDSSNDKLVKYLPIFMFVVFFVFAFWDTVIQDVIVNKMESESGVERQRWNLMAIDAFQSKPIFGDGYGKLRASSLPLTILANLGIVGLFVYYLSIIHGLAPIFILKNKEMRMLIVSRLIMFCVVISQIIACPDLTLCTFWLSVYIIAVTRKTYSMLQLYKWCLVRKILFLNNWFSIDNEPNKRVIM